ncbi:hypothetical protein CSKR_200136 [Clonorchis sinensis]|uniref:Secreted protein n=1 Tax=Clonorchis sinensis TaxID=79923 RepID=A0A8T1LY62_CLOSI|nr:hypothetical protein CSKR_200136 [Clonorchis sinensis]
MSPLVLYFGTSTTMVQMYAFRMSTNLLFMLALVFVVECPPADAWGGHAVPLVDRMRKSPYQSGKSLFTYPAHTEKQNPETSCHYLKGFVIPYTADNFCFFSIKSIGRKKSSFDLRRTAVKDRERTSVYDFP